MRTWLDVGIIVVAFASGTSVGWLAGRRRRFRGRRNAAVADERRTVHRQQPWPLRFVYEDAQGTVSSRTLDDWQVDDEYIHGFDRLRTGQERTFRRDRIQRWLGSSESMVAASAGPAATSSGGAVE